MRYQKMLCDNVAYRDRCTPPTELIRDFLDGQIEEPVIEPTIRFRVVHNGVPVIHNGKEVYYEIERK